MGGTESKTETSSKFRDTKTATAGRGNTALRQVKSVPAYPSNSLQIQPVARKKLFQYLERVPKEPINVPNKRQSVSAPLKSGQAEIASVAGDTVPNAEPKTRFVVSSAEPAGGDQANSKQKEDVDVEDVVDCENTESQSSIEIDFESDRTNPTDTSTKNPRSACREYNLELEKLYQRNGGSANSQLSQESCHKLQDKRNYQEPLDSLESAAKSCSSQQSDRRLGTQETVFILGEYIGNIETERVETQEIEIIGTQHVTDDIGIQHIAYIGNQIDETDDIGIEEFECITHVTEYPKTQEIENIGVEIQEPECSGIQTNADFGIYEIQSNETDIQTHQEAQSIGITKSENDIFGLNRTERCKFNPVDIERLSQKVEQVRQIWKVKRSKAAKQFEIENTMNTYNINQDEQIYLEIHTPEGNHINIPPPMPLQDDPQHQGEPRHQPSYSKGNGHIPEQTQAERIVGRRHPPNYSSENHSIPTQATRPLRTNSAVSNVRASSANSNIRTNSSLSTDSSTKRKLIIRGLKNFKESRGSGCPPTWVKEFPCRSKYHPENYIYDFDEGPLAPKRNIHAMHQCSKRGGRCTKCGVCTVDLCPTCSNCAEDCPCPNRQRMPHRPNSDILAAAGLCNPMETLGNAISQANTIFHGTKETRGLPYPFNTGPGRMAGAEIAPPPNYFPLPPPPPPPFGGSSYYPYQYPYPPSHPYMYPAPPPPCFYPPPPPGYFQGGPPPPYPYACPQGMYGPPPPPQENPYLQSRGRETQSQPLYNNYVSYNNFDDNA